MRTFLFLFSFMGAEAFADSVLSPLSQVESLRQEELKAVVLSKKGQSSAMALDIVRQKLQSFTWSLERYPKTAEEMLLKPRLVLGTSLDPNTESIAPRWEISETVSGGVCKPLAIPFLSGQTTEPHCRSSATSFSPDRTKLGSVEMRPGVGSEQRGFITVLNLDALSEPERQDFFSNPGFVLSERSPGLQTVSLKFLSYVASINDPGRLKAIRVQAGSLLSDVPISEPSYCIQVSCSARYKNGSNSSNSEWQDEACSTGLKASDGWEWDSGATCDTDAKAAPCERVRGHFSSHDSRLPNTLDLKLRNWSPASPCDREGHCNTRYTMTSRACRPGEALPLQYVESGTGRILGIDVSQVRSRSLASLSCPNVSKQVLGCTGKGTASCASPKREIGKSAHHFCRAREGQLGHFVVSEISQGMMSYWLSSAGKLFRLNKEQPQNPSSLWTDGKILSFTSHEGSWYALRSDGALLKSETPEIKESFLEIPCVKLERATSLISDALSCL